LAYEWLKIYKPHGILRLRVDSHYASAKLTSPFSERFVIKIQRSDVWWAFDEAVFTVYAPVQLGIVQISLNSSAICSNSSEVGTVIYIGCSTFQMAFLDSRTMSCTVFFPTRKSIPETQMNPQWQDT